MSDFKEYISNISKTNINTKLSEQASTVYDIAVKIEVLSDKLRRLEFKLELAESKIYRNMSVKYSALKNITPTRINHEVNCAEEVVELKEQILEVKKGLGVAKAKMKALEVFTDTLTNYGHNLREEKKSSSLNKIKN